MSNKPNEIDYKKSYESTLAALNGWLYGMEAAASKLFPHPQLFYRQLAISCIKLWSETCRRLGAWYVEKGMAPLEACKKYIQTLNDIKLIDQNDFTCIGTDSEFQINVRNCIFTENCQRHIREGRSILACPRGIIFLGILDFVEKGMAQKYKFDVHFETNNCLITITEFEPVRI